MSFIALIYSVVIILGGNNYIMRLVPCILAGFFISSEYSMGTMKSIVASGNNRIRIYCAKLLAFTMGAILISISLPIVMTGASSIYFGFYEMPDLLVFIQTVSLTVLYAAAFASIMAMFSTVFTDSGKSIAFLLLFFLMVDSILFILSTKSSFFELIFNYSVFKLSMDITQLDGISYREWIPLIVVPVVTFIVFCMIGSWIFQKKEIK